MATPNVLGVYELLRRAMQQQGAGFCSTPNAVPESYLDSHGTPQGGLLGRLLALEAQQSPYQPFAKNDRTAPAAPPDPDFRQLSRAPIAVQPQGAIGPSNRADDKSRPSYSPVGDSTSPGTQSTSPYDVRLFGAAGDKPVPPPISMPAIPDWLKVAGKILQFDPTTWGHNDEYRRCMRAAAAGTQEWTEFCNSLGARQNNVSGGESARKACWSKGLESEVNKRNWCENQFGDND